MDCQATMPSTLLWHTLLLSSTSHSHARVDANSSSLWREPMGYTERFKQYKSKLALLMAVLPVSSELTPQRMLTGPE